MSKFNEMIDEEILFYVDGITRHQRKDIQSWQHQVLSFHVGDITVWISLGNSHSFPECAEKNIWDYQAFVIQMFDKDEGDAFGAPDLSLGSHAIHPALDIRFQDQPWASRFSGGGTRAAMMPVAEFCQIIRFVEKVQKLTAFL